MARERRPAEQQRRARMGRLADASRLRGWNVKLSDLDPSAVALDVARAAHAHVCDLTIRLLSPACEGPWLPQGVDTDASLRSTQIYLTVRDLAAYALEGAPLDAPVHEYLVSLIPLWSATCGDGTTEIDGIVEREPTTDLGRVIALAVAREALDQGRPITAYQLATLGGITVQHARRLVAGGELGTPGVGGHGEGHAIGAVEARAWLAGRKINLQCQECGQAKPVDSLTWPPPYQWVCVEFCPQCLCKTVHGIGRVRCSGVVVDGDSDSAVFSQPQAPSEQQLERVDQDHNEKHHQHDLLVRRGRDQRGQIPDQTNDQHHDKQRDQ